MNGKKKRSEETQLSSAREIIPQTPEEDLERDKSQVTERREKEEQKLQHKYQKFCAWQAKIEAERNISLIIRISTEKELEEVINLFFQQNMKDLKKFLEEWEMICVAKYFLKRHQMQMSKELEIKLKNRFNADKYTVVHTDLLQKKRSIKNLKYWKPSKFIDESNIWPPLPNFVFWMDYAYDGDDLFVADETDTVLYYDFSTDENIIEFGRNVKPEDRKYVFRRMMIRLQLTNMLDQKLEKTESKKQIIKDRNKIRKKRKAEIELRGITLAGIIQAERNCRRLIWGMEKEQRLNFLVEENDMKINKQRNEKLIEDLIKKNVIEQEWLQSLRKELYQLRLLYT